MTTTHSRRHSRHRLRFPNGSHGPTVREAPENTRPRSDDFPVPRSAVGAGHQTAIVQDARLGVMAGGAGMQFHQPSFRRRVLDIAHLCPGCTGVDPAEIVPERLGHLVDDFLVEIAAYGASDQCNPFLDRFSVFLDLAWLNLVAVAELSRPFATTPPESFFCPMNRSSSVSENRTNCPQESMQPFT